MKKSQRSETTNQNNSRGNIQRNGRTIIAGKILKFFLMALIKNPNEIIGKICHDELCYLINFHKKNSKKFSGKLSKSPKKLKRNCQMKLL